MRLVLFDIDGTLLWTDGAGRRAIHRALREELDVDVPDGYRFDGKTDPQIVRELVRMRGSDERSLEGRIEELLAIYARYLQEELTAEGHVAEPLPGVVDLLDALEARPEVCLGLLTGNIRDGATAKLRAVGIDPGRFVVGAFGSDHELRPELPAIARRRAVEALAHELAGDAMVVIGDTPADLTCGMALGVRAIGVATGRYSVEELAAYDPHAVLEDLTDTDAALAAILD
jgi:phosphoglycolate phosphatase